MVSHKAILNLLSSAVLFFILGNFEPSFGYTFPDTTKSQIERPEPQVVFEGEIEIEADDKVEMSYIFYKKDEISLIARPVKGKDISRFEFKRWGGAKMSEYKSKPTLELKFSIPETDAYTFVLQNTNILNSKTIYVKVSRQAINDSIQSMDVAFKSETSVDTSYVEILKKTVRLGRGVLKSNVETALMTIPPESDGNIAIIIGSEKEVAEWSSGVMTQLPGIDPASAIIGGILLNAIKGTGGNEINWSITDPENAQLALNGLDYKPYYFSNSVTFETKALKLNPGQTCYMIIVNPSMASAKDIQIQAKAQIIKQEVRPLIK